VLASRFVVDELTVIRVFDAQRDRPSEWRVPGASPRCSLDSTILRVSVFRGSSAAFGNSENTLFICG